MHSIFDGSYQGHPHDSNLEKLWGDHMYGRSKGSDPTTLWMIEWAIHSTPTLCRDMDLSYLAISDDEYDKVIFPASYYMDQQKSCLQVWHQNRPQSLMDNMDIDVDNWSFPWRHRRWESVTLISGPITPSRTSYHYLEDNDVHAKLLRIGWP